MTAVLRWMFILTLVVAIAGGAGAYWLYSRSDEALRTIVLQQLKTMAPTLKIDLVRANCDLMGRVRIYGLTVALPDDEPDQPSLEVEEVMATLTDFENFDNFVIQKLYFVRPKVRIVRHLDGTWNWQQAVFQPAAELPPLPDVEIANASLSTVFQRQDDAVRTLNLRDLNVSAHPADARRYSIQIATLLKSVGLNSPGPLTLEVDAAIDGSTWKCQSRDPWRIPVDAGLVQLLCDLSPEIASKVTNAGRWIDETKAIHAVAGSIGVPATEPMKIHSRVQTVSDAPDFGVTCDCDMTFQVQKDQPGNPIAFKVHADVAKGEIHNGILAFPLNEVAGQIYVDNRNLIVKDLRGSSGTTKVSFESKVVPSTPISATLKIRGVEVNDALKTRLPEPLRKLVNSIGLTGICNADATVTQEGGKWIPVVDLRLSKGTVTHERFPVTVRDVAGKLTVEKNVVEFNATGKYAGQMVSASGTVTNPGPKHQVDIVVKSNNLPLDDESLAACPLAIRKSIETLRLKGRQDVLLRVIGPTGPQRKYEPALILRVFDGSLSFQQFQYGIQKLQGLVTWKGDLVEFRELSGVHDGATLTGSGTFQRLPGPGRLDLTIDATNAAFDRSLEMALPTTLRQVWNNFRPQGIFDVQTKIAWIPGSPCEVRLPMVKVHDAEMLMRCFPLRLQRLKGEFSFNTDPANEPGKLVIKDFQAHHDDTFLSGRGMGWFPNQKPWRLEFDQLDIDNLIPNATLRSALPVALQRVYDSLQPEGDFSFHGPVEFRDLDRGDNSISANWKMRTVLSRCSLKAGTRIENIRGVAQLNGAWDGKNANLDGDLDLESVSIFRKPSGRAYQITGIRGPISFHDNKFVAGTETAIPPRKSDNPDSEKRIRGQVIDGTIFLDAAVKLGEEPSDKAFIELKKGQLESFAQQSLPGRSKLAGVMNGWMNLRGRGADPARMTGEGKLVIDQAALYDSPLFAQMFQLLKLQTPDRTAFENAAVNFTVANERFDLNTIELLGDTLSMRGRGYVRFDGGMEMDFGVRLRQWQWLPNNLTAVNVSGTVNDPQTRSVPFPELDGALKQFFKAFNPQQMNPRPGLFDSLTGQNLEAVHRN